MQCPGPKTRSLLQAYENVNRLLTDSSSSHLHPWSPSDSSSLCLFFKPAFPELALSGRGVGVGCSWILLEKGHSLSHQRGWWESREIRKLQFLSLPWGQLSPCRKRTPDQVSGANASPSAFSPMPRDFGFVPERSRDVRLSIQSTLAWGTALSLMPRLGQPEGGSRGLCCCLSVLERSPVHTVFMELAGSLPDWRPAQMPPGNLRRSQHPFHGKKLPVGSAKLRSRGFIYTRKPILPVRRGTFISFYHVPSSVLYPWMDYLIQSSPYSFEKHCNCPICRGGSEVNSVKVTKLENGKARLLTLPILSPTF